MPFYHRLNVNQRPEDKQAIEGLFRLRAALDTEIPDKTIDKNLLLATWNIRDFDKPAYGERSDEAIYYIAEIISRFDLVAVQEVYRDLAGLERVCRILGGYWKYIVTDATEGTFGNHERMAFLYDSRKVTFGGLCGELVLPPIKQSDGTKAPATQIWRTPMICGFTAGWSRFMLSTVHVLWGDNVAEPENRVNEIRQIAQFLKKRALDPTAWSRNLILLGDFNIFDPDDATFAELTKAGFEVPDQLQQLPSNTAITKARHYDQIAFRAHPDRLEQTNRAGVFDFFDYVYREQDQAMYIPQMGKAYNKTSKGKVRSESAKKTYYRTYWRTHQMSDHLPMWCELKIDFSEQYLRRKLTGDV